MSSIPSNTPLGRNNSRTRFRGTVHLATGVLGRDCFALVVLALALCEAEFELDPIAGPVEPQWHQRQPLLLDRDAEPDYLRLVQQKLAFALGLVIVAMTPLIRADVNVDEEGFSPTEAHISLAQVAPA